MSLLPRLFSLSLLCVRCRRLFRFKEKKANKNNNNHGNMPESDDEVTRDRRVIDVSLIDV